MALTSMTKVDATSAVLQYNGTWHRGGMMEIPIQASNVPIRRWEFFFVTFEFSGFEVDIFGAYRANDGRYNVYFDDVLQSTNRTDPSGTPANDDDKANYQQSLFHWQGKDGRHSVALENFPLAGQVNSQTNQKLMNMDVDYVQWFSTVAHLENATIDNSNLSHFEYHGDPWKESASLPGFPSFVNGGTGQCVFSTSHILKGDRVTLFGVTGPQLSPFSIQVDSGPSVLFNATTPATTQADATLGNQVLFTTSGLSQDATHTLSIVANPRPSQTFAIDYAIVDAAANSQNTSSLNQGKLSSSGGVAALFILLISAFLLIRMRRRKKNNLPYPADGSSVIESYPSSFQTNVTAPVTFPSSTTYHSNRVIDDVPPPDYEMVSAVGSSTQPQTFGARKNLPIPPSKVA
ncbi:hypothetical protein DL96DRAFT_1616063 [Flagelloscypha sp. PMI_526]|nr:hypothetical protein DL96DRAFT_1616063 [Flagelloscypha sp. PMI_526]